LRLPDELSLSSLEKKKIITIDGPAGAGKSTVSKALAKKLGYIYLDTGALYRALAHKALKDKISLEDTSALAKLCFNTTVSLKNIDGKMVVLVDGENVGDKIRTEEVGLAASKISAFTVVRKSLLNLQREAGLQGCIVAEGRDMGSIVFPHADYKFYLDANVEERIKRRYNELLAKGAGVEYQAIQKDMMARDYQDSKRKIAPLKASADAIIIDSTGLSAKGVVEKIIQYICAERGGDRLYH
jgi:cytidylate kinase